MVFDQVSAIYSSSALRQYRGPSLVGSVEFAANRYNTTLVVVMGHTQCGAIKAALDNIEEAEVISSANILDI